MREMEICKSCFWESVTKQVTKLATKKTEQEIGLFVVWLSSFFISIDLFFYISFFIFCILLSKVDALSINV